MYMLFINVPLFYIFSCHFNLILSFSNLIIVLLSFLLLFNIYIFLYIYLFIANSCSFSQHCPEDSF